MKTVTVSPPAHPPPRATPHQIGEEPNIQEVFANDPDRLALLK